MDAVQGATLRLKILELEYVSLRAELSATSTARFQFVAVPSVVVAISVSIVGTSQRRASWLIPIFFSIVGVLLGTGIAVFIWIGRMIGNLSARVAQVETDMNRVMAEVGIVAHGTIVIDWERQHQLRSGFAKFYNGRGTLPTGGPDVVRQARKI